MQRVVADDREVGGREPRLRLPKAQPTEPERGKDDDRERESPGERTERVAKDPLRTNRFRLEQSAERESVAADGCRVVSKDQEVRHGEEREPDERPRVIPEDGRVGEERANRRRGERHADRCEGTSDHQHAPEPTPRVQRAANLPPELVGLSRLSHYPRG